MMSKELQRRLLHVLHRGLVEIRLLAQAGRHQQVSDLADLLEQIPGWLVHGEAPSEADIERELELHEGKYPDSFKYSGFVRRLAPPPF